MLFVKVMKSFMVEVGGVGRVNVIGRFVDVVVKVMVNWRNVGFRVKKVFGGEGWMMGNGEKGEVDMWGGLMVM
nr:hypothetical protein [Priestia megaterium]